MIVKNESPVIRRCLASVKPIIDTWVIVDTGSTDGTQRVIQEFMKDIPGELHERPWVDFAHNRNEALELAKGKSDYVLFIDADEELFFPDSYELPPLEKDCYYCTLKLHKSTSHRKLLVNNHLPWKWEGVMHEQLVCSDPFTSAVLIDIVNSAEAKDGNRSQNPQKYLRDAQVLEEALKIDPNNSRHVFYLAQSYLQAKEYEKSLESYEKFISLKDPNVISYTALYYIGMLSEQLGKSSEKIINGYSLAFQDNSRRAEPLFRLSVYHFSQKQYLLAYSLAKLATSMENPRESLYNEDWIYEYGSLYALGNAATALQYYEEAKECYQKILSIPTVPIDIMKEVENNLNKVLEKLRITKEIL